VTRENVFDVIVIGAGPAGEIAAARAVRAGLTTAVERRWAGGELAGPIDTAAVTARRDEFVAHYDDGPQVSWVEKLPATFVRGQGRQHASAALAEAGVQVAALSVDDEATTTGGTRLRLEPGQAVIPHGIDHDLTTGEMHPREQR
jgi:choline dehydrogenase-like flavoprotein